MSDLKARQQLNADDIDQIVEGIEHFCIGPGEDEDRELTRIWQPFIEKLKALRAALLVGAEPHLEHQLAVADWISRIETAMFGKADNTFSARQLTALRAAIAQILAVGEEPAADHPLNVDTVAAELDRGHYSLLRSAMAQRAEAGQRIILEELCQLVRAFSDPEPAADHPSPPRDLLHSWLTEDAHTAEDGSFERLKEDLDTHRESDRIRFPVQEPAADHPQEKEDTLARVDTPGSSVDSLTASSNELIRTKANDYARKFDRIASAHGFELPMTVLIPLVTLFGEAQVSTFESRSPDGDGPQGQGAQDDGGKPNRLKMPEAGSEPADSHHSHGQAPAANSWHPIATAPRDADLFFWVVPKTADESYTDTSGKPIFSTHPPRLHRGCYGSWSALEKATHWMPLPAPPGAASPPQQQEKEEDDQARMDRQPKASASLPHRATR